MLWRPVDDLFDLVDVSGMNLDDITDDSVLAHSMRRVLDDVDRELEPVAGWNAAIG